MTTNNERNGQNKKVGGQDSQDTYSFIKETRKEKPIDRRLWLKRILATGGLAIAGGILAALVFVLMVPVFQNVLHKSKNEKIEMAVVASSSEEEGEKEETGAETEVETEVESEPVVSLEDEQAAAMEQFVRLHQGMMAQVKEMESSMVEVIGITSQLDYFNLDYENRQSVAGVLVAESESTLYCLTENRDLKKAEEIQIIFCNNAKAKAEVENCDKETNLAILRIDRSEINDSTWNTIKIAQFGNSASMRPGTPVIAVGSITGHGDSMAYGIITSIKNTVSMWDVNYNVLTTDMIGNTSGSGCLINLDGEAVGIIRQNLSEDDQNLITAIPVHQLGTLIESMINDQPQIRIGIKGQTVSSDISDSSGIPRGVLVTKVDTESPAMYAGIKELDVIVAVDGQPVDNFQAYQRVIGSLTENQEITVDAMRRGTETYEEISFQLTPETK